MITVNQDLKQNHSKACKFSINSRSIQQSEESQLNGYILHPNYPNPFNLLTTISYTLPEPEFVTLQIFDITGRLVRSLVYEPQEAGVHTIEWNAKDSFGNRVASGVYLCRLKVANIIRQQKMILTK